MDARLGDGGPFRFSWDVAFKWVLKGGLDFVAGVEEGYVPGGGGQAHSGIRAENAGRPWWWGRLSRLGVATGSGRVDGTMVSQQRLGPPGGHVPHATPSPFPSPAASLGLVSSGRLASLPFLPPLAAALWLCP